VQDLTPQPTPDLGALLAKAVQKATDPAVRAWLLALAGGEGASRVIPGETEEEFEKRRAEAQRRDLDREAERFAQEVMRIRTRLEERFCE
jgi:hypothetical protein